MESWCDSWHSCMGGEDYGWVCFDEMQGWGGAYCVTLRWSLFYFRIHCYDFYPALCASGGSVVGVWRVSQWIFRKFFCSSDALVLFLCLFSKNFTRSPLVNMLFTCSSFYSFIYLCKRAIVQMILLVHMLLSLALVVVLRYLLCTGLFFGLG